MTHSENKNSSRLFGLAALLVGLIAIFDFSLPLGVAGGVPYVLLVLLGGWFPKPKHIIVLAIVGSIMTVF